MHHWLVQAVECGISVRDGPLDQSTYFFQLSHSLHFRLSLNKPIHFATLQFLTSNVMERQKGTPCVESLWRIFFASDEALTFIHYKTLICVPCVVSRYSQVITAQFLRKSSFSDKVCPMKVLVAVIALSLSSLTAAQATCTPGYYDDGVDGCKKCPLGTYQPNEGETECKPCHDGFYQHDRGEHRV